MAVTRDGIPIRIPVHIPVRVWLMARGDRRFRSQPKTESGFADVPADQMTPRQYQELAARYNGGPYWQSDDAQRYGRGFLNNVGDAREALR